MIKLERSATFIEISAIFCYKILKNITSLFFQLIHKYLEIDSFHRVIYVGPEKGSIAPQVEKHFCLINKIQSVYPGKITLSHKKLFYNVKNFHVSGKIDYADVKDNKKLLAFKIAHVGAEDFFSQVQVTASKYIDISCITSTENKLVMK